MASRQLEIGRVRLAAFVGNVKAETRLAAVITGRDNLSLHANDFRAAGENWRLFLWQAGGLGDPQRY